MKLLIITQKVDVNNDVLGFMHGWIAEFAKHCEKLIVICLQKGEYDLPNNVNVLSLGKEKYLREEVWLQGGAKRRKKPNLKEQIFFRVKYIFNFYKYIWQERGNYDKVFIHMNPEYVVLGGVFWRLLRKRVGLWYTHKAVNLKLRIAEKFADVIFTASKESFRLPSRKVKVMGHGININQLSITTASASEAGQANYQLRINEDKKFKIITVGRISPIKDYETLINAIEILYNRRNEALPRSGPRVEIIGGPATPEDEKYLDELKKIVAKKKLNSVINFIGSVPNKDIVQYYNNADLFVNMSMTGSLDKVILEAMACGIIALSCNDASKDLLEKYNLFFQKGDFKGLAEKIQKIIELPIGARDQIGEGLRRIVVKEHNLNKLIKNIITEI